MLSWDTTTRLIKGKANPLLIGLVIEELESAIEELQEQRETEELTSIEEELLRGFMAKRFLLIKKLRDHFRLQDFDDDTNIEKVVQEYCATREDCKLCKKRTG